MEYNVSESQSSTNQNYDEIAIVTNEPGLEKVDMRENPGNAIDWV